MTSENNNQRSDIKKSPQNILLIYLLLLMAFLIWNGIKYANRQQDEIKIPYSEFIKQLKSDNVRKVVIEEDKIKGSFLKAILFSDLTIYKQDMEARSKYDEEFKDTGKTFTGFQTTFPQAIGDPNLLVLLEQHNVMVDVISSTRNKLITTLLSWLPFLLLILFFLWMSNQAMGRRGNMFGFGKSKARLYQGDKKVVTFDDIAGADEAKAQLQQEVDFLSNPKKYHDIGAKIPRGILLIGPPGTGKTLLAKAVAGEAGVPFLSISASEFVEMFVGVGASRVRDLFAQGKQAAPSIIFIDELDAVARRRGAGMGTVNDEREQTLNQLLVEMDGFDERLEVIILAATNRPDVLDPALLRPGRFDRQVALGLPDREGRKGILKIHTRRLKLDPDVDFSLLARSSTGMSGADLANLCNEAALVAARKDNKKVCMADFEQAFDKVLLGEKRKLYMDPKEREVIAYHEAGHAVAAWFIPEADQVHKVTIIPHGKALGVTQQLPTEDHYNLSKAYLMARLAVLLAGRTAEEIAIGEITTGAENDLIEATQLARKMVTRWGMGKLGLRAFRADEEHPFLGYELSRGKDYSESTAAIVDEEVKKLLDKSHETVHKILVSNKEKLDATVHLLLKDETIDSKELEKILGPRGLLKIVEKPKQNTNDI